MDAMRLEVELTPNEARLFGVLIEKAFTTPEQYPLTLNAVINGANQKTNREPVMSLSEEETLLGLEGLVTKHLVRRVFPENSRVEKYSHRGGEMLVLPAESLAVLGELLLRGPQTPGEIRARASRMRSMGSVEELTNALAPAIERGYVTRLAPAPGSRAERYGQLFCPQAHVAAAAPAAASDSDLSARVAELETEVDRLRRQLRGLAARLGQDLEE
jgi:uncharacterized protein